jgi:hypothetical protein
MQPHQKRQANCGAFLALVHLWIGYVKAKQDRKGSVRTETSHPIIIGATSKPAAAAEPGPCTRRTAITWTSESDDDKDLESSSSSSSLSSLF